MRVICHTTAEAFLSNAQAWLERAEAENNVVLGIALSFKLSTVQSKVRPYFFTVDDDEKIIGAGLMTPPRRLLMTRMSEPAVIALADYLLAERAPLPGVLGPTAEANLFVEHWTRQTGRSAHLKMRERLYKCEQAATLTYASGSLRPAQQEDKGMLWDWCLRFCVDAGIEDEAIYFKARLPRKIADRSLFVWQADEAVSMAGLERETSRGVAISWVYTPPHLRNRGYATASVAALTRQSLESGKEFCCLYADLANPASNSIYQKLGYQPIFDVQDWIFEPR